MHPLFTFLKTHIAHRMELELGANKITAKPTYTEFKEVRRAGKDRISKFIRRHRLGEDDTILALVALAPHVYPSFFDDIMAHYLPNGGEFPEFGGIKGKNHRGFLPTLQTALFILAGTDPERISVERRLFNNDRRVFQLGIIHMMPAPSGEPRMSGQLIMDDEHVESAVTGVLVKPTMSQNFPAELIETGLEWENLILKEKTLNEIKDIETWLEHNETLLDDWEMKHIIKPGYRVMFYGPPGTGKTLTATLLGKYTDRDVYRVDLSMVVSKYIGETEKNLSNLFNKAMHKDWILFFDEADAIFGKRTNVRDAHDKYANQEVSYLLQRIEAHPGLVILASNIKDNIDEAFARRFQSIIEFEAPTSEERARIWQSNFPKNAVLSDEICLEEISERYDITGANIVNVIQYACLQQLANKNDELQLDHLVEGIRREYKKEGKII